MAYIYRHIRLDTNLPFYIGKGSEDGGQYKRANSTALRNRIWNSIVSRTAYKVQIVLDDLTEEEALQKEKEFISIYGRIDIKTGILCNLTIGGDGCVGLRHTEESRRRISEALKSRPKEINQRAGQKNALKWTDEKRLAQSIEKTGTKHTPETIEKMKKAQVKKHLPKEKFYRSKEWRNSLTEEQVIELKKKQDAGRHGFEIEAFDVKTNLSLGVYPSAFKCARDLKVSASTIFRYLNGVSKSPLRFYFKLKK